MPNVDELAGCLAADRAGVKKRLTRIKARKEATKKDLYKRILKARQLIDLDPAQPLSVEKLAQHAGIAEAHFARTFKESFGASPVQYQRERRIALARHLLASTDDSILDVSLRVGFESPTSFATLFRKAQGMTPVEFRQRTRNDAKLAVPKKTASAKSNKPVASR